MDTYHAITTKRDTRAYDQRPIPEDALERILQAGRMAGSARAAEPVRLIVLRDFGQKERLAACGNATTHVVAAPLAVAIVLVPEFGVVGAPFTLFRGPFDGGRCAQNMILAAWELGITSCPASMHNAEAAAEVLGLPPGHYVLNVIAFGYPEGADPMTGSRPRMAMDEFVRHERW
jgi:nitroreductase